MRALAAAIVAPLVSLIPLTGVQAAPPVCGQHETLVDRLKGAYEETRAGAGLAHDGVLVELFTSPDGGTWTIVLTSPTGKACLVGAGEAWQESEGAPRPEAYLLPRD